jgi:forkhead box protein K
MGGKFIFLLLIFDPLDWAADGVQGSVRHNLSSGKAFTKLEKSTSDRGKGWFWGVSPEFERSFEEQEAKAAAAAAGGSSDGFLPKKKKKEPKDKFVSLASPFANTPLSFKNTSGTSPMTTPPLADGVKRDPGTSNGFPVSMQPVSMYPSVSAATGQPSSSTTTWLAAPIPSAVIPAPPVPTPSTSGNNGAPGAPVPSLNPTLRIPIIVGPLPASYALPPSTSGEPVKRPPIVLHENTLILDPSKFGTLTPERLAEMEALGTQEALKALQAHMRERRGAKPKKKKKVEGGVVAGDVSTVSAMAALQPSVPAPSMGNDTEDLIVVVDSDDEGPVTKKRRTQA